MFEKIKASDGNPYTPDAVFTDSDGNKVGVIGQDTTPNLSVSEMQFSVEAVVREVVIPAYNSLVDALNALAAASNMGAADINGDASTVQAELTKRIITGNVKYIRLNSDKVLETSNDGETWEATGSSGHIIIKPDGTVAPQRSRMKFVNGTVTDDGTQTIITGLKGDTGPQGEKGDTGAQGPKGEQGLTGPVIVPSVDANGVMSFTIQDTAIAPQPVSVRGPQGPQGVQGAQGAQGERGPQGIQGVAGKQGIQGEQGETGPAGPQGIQGVQGPVGPAGPTGPQGPVGPQGEQGLPGADGKSFVIQDIFATLGELKSTYPTGNDYAYQVTSENKEIFIWSENTGDWESLGALQGPQGPAGPQGIQGEQGIQGIQGPQGEQGIQGATGPQGPQGIQGIQGEQGPVGPQGEQGPAGVAGADGKSAYQTAVEGGYSGTETAFNAELAALNTKPNMVIAEIPKGRMRGDVDGDGKITENDAVLVSGQASGAITLTGADLWCADVNGDNRINGTDKLQLNKYFSGQPNALTRTPTFADYYNNWTYHKVDDTSGYWTTELSIPAITMDTEGSIIWSGTGFAGTFIKAETFSGGVRIYANYPPIEALPCAVSYHTGVGGQFIIANTGVSETGAKYVLVKLTASGWSEEKKQTISVPGLKEDALKQLIIPTQSSTSIEKYHSAGIRISARGDNTLTFSCDTIPTENIEVVLVIIPIIGTFEG